MGELLLFQDGDGGLRAVPREHWSRPPNSLSVEDNVSWCMGVLLDSLILTGLSRYAVERMISDYSRFSVDVAEHRLKTAEPRRCCQWW